MENEKKAIIMGATSGIGKEVAKQLAARGWQLGLAGRRIGLLEQSRQEIPQVKAVKQIDVTDRDAPRLLDELITETGGMDLYFHSSGIGYQNVELDVEKELATINTNGMGFTRMLTAAFRHLAGHPGKHGQIAVISSIAGTKGLGAAPAYSSSKRFQSHYLECLEQLARIRRLPVSFTDIRPGFVDTDLIKGSRYPLRLKAEDVARHIVRAIERKRRVAVVDWRYRMLVFFWKLVPGRLWVRLKVASRHEI